MIRVPATTRKIAPPIITFSVFSVGSGMSAPYRNGRTNTVNLGPQSGVREHQSGQLDSNQRLLATQSKEVYATGSPDNILYFYRHFPACTVTVGKGQNRSMPGFSGLFGDSCAQVIKLPARSRGSVGLADDVMAWRVKEVGAIVKAG
jgi:hypothetical protein